MAADLLVQRIVLMRQGYDLEDAPSVFGQLAIAMWESDGDLNQIEDHLEKAAQSPGNLELAWRQRIQTILRLQEEDPEQAERLERELLYVMEDLCDRLPRNPEPAWLTATSYSIQKKFSMTLEFLEEVKFRAEFTDNPELWLGEEYWFDVATALERTGQLEKSEEVFLSILEENGQHHRSLNYLAYTWAEQGIHLDRALEFVQRALQLDPENRSYIDTLGWIYYKQGRFQDAYRELLRSAELIPDESVVLEHLGDVLMKLDRPLEARGYYRIALALDPGERRNNVLESLEASEQAVSASVQATWITPSRGE